MVFSLIMRVSIITPIYNEAGNLKELFRELYSVISGLKLDYEIIAINDGSKDDTRNILKTLSAKDNNFKVINFAHNYGQTAALSAGISHASGDVLIPMDSDMENDPVDIPRLLDKLSEGYDVVSGWRRDRWGGKWLTRKLPSMVANRLISFITGIKLHDYGCTLKAYRRDVIVDVQLYGEMHRFIPAYAAWKGAKITEIEVKNRKRLNGVSNYGISRTYKVILDLLLIRFLTIYMNRPIHFFGGIGIISLMLGTVAGAFAVFLRIFYGFHFISSPLPVFSALFLIVGVQLAIMGLLAEIIMRTYYESQQKTPYTIGDKLNF